MVNLAVHPGCRRKKGQNPYDEESYGLDRHSTTSPESNNLLTCDNRDGTRMGKKWENEQACYCVLNQLYGEHLQKQMIKMRKNCHHSLELLVTSCSIRMFRNNQDRASCLVSAPCDITAGKNNLVTLMHVFKDRKSVV